MHILHGCDRRSARNCMESGAIRGWHVGCDRPPHLTRTAQMSSAALVIRATRKSRSAAIRKDLRSSDG